MEKIKLPNRPIGPFPTVLVGANVAGKPNYVTAGACGVVSLEPILYVSLKDTHYTTGGINATGYFSVNLPNRDLVQQTDYCGVVSGKTADKSELFTAFYDGQGPAPLIKECPLNFLCEVVQTIPVYGFTMFLGKIVAVYANDNCLSDSQPDPLKLDPLIMMGANYCTLGGVGGKVFQDGMEYKKATGR